MQSQSLIQWRNLTDFAAIGTSTYTTPPVNDTNYTGNLTANETFAVQALSTLGTIRPLSGLLRSFSQNFHH
jgi:hypothetical protein